MVQNNLGFLSTNKLSAVSLGSGQTKKSNGGVNLNLKTHWRHDYKFCRDMDARASPKSPRNFGIKRCCARAFQSKVKSSDHTSLCASNRFFFVYFFFLKKEKREKPKIRTMIRNNL